MKQYLLLTLMLASCGATRSQSLSVEQRAPAADVTALPPAKEPLHLVPGGKKKELTCQDLLTELGRVTGVTFSAPPDLRADLDHTQLGVPGSLDVPAESAWTTAESLLVARGFLLEVLSRDPVIVDVMSLESRGRSPAPRSRASFVSPDSLSAWAEHPAFVIRATLDMEAINIRDLSNSMRQLFTDPQVQQIIPIGNTQTLLVCGMAPMVADLFAMLRRLDRAEQELCDRLGVEPETGIVRRPKAK